MVAQYCERCGRFLPAPSLRSDGAGSVCCWCASADGIGDQAEQERAISHLCDWYDAWHFAWEALEAQGACDGLGGAEYRRLTAEALWMHLEASQGAMRRFIRERANVAHRPTVTEESVARRKERAKKKGGQGDG